MFNLSNRRKAFRAGLEISTLSIDTGEYIYITEDVTLDLLSDFTISLWLYPTDVGTATNIISNWWFAVNDRSLQVFYTGSGELTIAISDDGSSSSVLSTSLILTQDVWNFIQVSYNSGIVSASIDDGSIWSDSFTGPLHDSGRDWYIGANNSGIVDTSLSLASIKFFDSKRSVSQITEIYNGGEPKPHANYNPSNMDDSVLAIEAMDDQPSSGNELIDQSSEANVVNLVGPPTITGALITIDTA